MGTETFIDGQDVRQNGKLNVKLKYFIGSEVSSFIKDRERKELVMN